MKNSRIKLLMYLHYFQSFGQFEIFKFDHPQSSVQGRASRVQHPEPSIQAPASRVLCPESFVESPASNTCVQSRRTPVCLSKNIGWTERRIFLKWFLFIFCIEQECIARNQEFQFVSLTKAVHKKKSRFIFYMNRFDSDES